MLTIQKALQQFQDVIAYSKRKGNESLAREARKDLVRAFSMWSKGDPKKARGYFKKFADGKEDLDKMMERLARFYTEAGETDRSIYDAMAALIIHGVFQRHPGVRVCSIENGSDWSTRCSAS